MKWLTAKSQVKVLCAAAALITTCGAALAQSTDSEEFQRFKDPNQWGAPAGNRIVHFRSQGKAAVVRRGLRAPSARSVGSFISVSGSRDSG